MTIIVLTEAATTIEAAIDWLAAQGARTFKLWRGRDGLIRGHGMRP